jgi:hypothetical protein
VRRRYHRIGERRWSYAEHDSGDEFEFDVDTYGLAGDIDTRFRRH